MEGARLFDIKTFKQITEHSIYMDGTIKDKIKNNWNHFLTYDYRNRLWLRENEKVDVIALGSDNNPLIVLFKTAQNESVAARAVFYLDWLVNNKNLFNKLVQKLSQVWMLTA